MKQEFQDQVRVQINRYIMEKGFAPSTSTLALLLNTVEDEIKSGLQQLADNHAIVLHPNSFKIWVAHPFALFPTLFWVESGTGKWWGNCVWCSLGIAAIAKADCSIFTKLSGEKHPMRIDVKNGSVLQNDLLVHFAIPAKQIWDNVIYTCSNMLAFETEAQIDDWCERHDVRKGEVVPINQVWELARHWYGNYLEDTWTRKTAEYAESIFGKVGLSGEFWKLT